MAHYAKLDQDNNVTAIVVVDNSNTINSNGNEDENIGINFLTTVTGWPLWKRTSYNTRGNKYYNSDNTEGDSSRAYRGNFANIGYTYNEDSDVFISPKPYESWTFNTTTVLWTPPVAYPENTFTDGILDPYTWNETSRSWDKM